jgi:hypothetical protein
MRVFPVVLSVVLVSVGALAFALGGGGGGADPVEPPPPVNTAFAGVLLRVGLGADTLAAAGISGQQTTALVTAVEQSYNPGTLATKDEGYITAKQNHDRLRRLVTSGKGSQEDVTALRTAETTLATANTQRETYLTGLRTAGLAIVSEGQRTLANRIQANGSWRFPTQYLVKDRTEAQWVVLRDLLAAKQIHVKDATAPFPEASQSQLAAIDAENEIATAKVNLDAGMVSVQTAWNAAAAD